MKINGRLTFKNEEDRELVNIIAKSLASDNVSGMKTFIEYDSATVVFSGDKVGTILASVDDYLMNAIIVEKLSYILNIDFRTPLNRHNSI
jgi:hypothetical protein